MEDKIITLKNFDTMVDAMVDQEVLQTNGIECFIGNEGLVELFPMFSESDEGLKIVVFEKDSDKAMKILSVGATKVATNQNLLLATNASVVLALMNTDEFITRH